MSVRAVDVLNNAYVNQPCYIVGRGPSLAYLQARHFGPGPVIVLNDAIVHVQELGLVNIIYSFQKDAYDWAVQRPVDHIALILQDQYGSELFPEHPTRLMVDPVVDMGFASEEMSIRMAIRMTIWMGCSGIRFVCCDSLNTGDLRSYGSDGSVSNRADYMYQYVKPLVVSDLKDIPHDFITPIP